MKYQENMEANQNKHKWLNLESTLEINVSFKIKLNEMWNVRIEYNLK